MANRYWVNPAGTSASWTPTNTTNWSATSGGPGGASVPTSADDVFFNASSGRFDGIATGTANAKSLDLTGFTGSFGGVQSINLSGNLTFSSTMTLTGLSGYTFLASATITTQNLIPTLGRNQNLVVNGTGITVTLNGNWYGANNGNITVTNGTLNVNSSIINIGGILLNSGGTRSISFSGSPTITLGAATAINANGATSFNAGTSQINVTAVSPTVVGMSTLHNLSFTNTAIGTANLNTVTNLNSLTFAQKTTNALSLISTNSSTITIAGALTINSGQTDPTRRYQWFPSTIGTTRTISANSVDIVCLDFMDIAASGSASWNDSSRTRYWGDCKGNSGITFAAGRTVYWNLAGAQVWNAVGWSNVSGGTPDAQYFPLAQDTAVFNDAGSVTGTISINTEFALGTVDMSARTSAMTLGGFGSRRIHGNWTNGSGTTISSTGFMVFQGRNTQTLTSAGKSFNSGVIEINSPGGTVLLADDLTHTGTTALRLNGGTFNANNYNVTTPSLQSLFSGTRAVNMGSGTWTLTGAADVWQLNNIAGLTINASTSTIVCTNTTTTDRRFNGAGFTYNNITIGGTTGTSIFNFLGGGIYNTLSSTKTVAHTIRFQLSTTNTFTNFNINGTAGNVVTLASCTSTGGASDGQHTLAKAGGGTVTVNYFSIQDSTATPDLTWLAINSTDVVDNSGWYFGAFPATSSGNFFLMFGS